MLNGHHHPLKVGLESEGLEQEPWGGFLLGVMAVLPWFMIWLEPESLGCTSVLLSPFSQCVHLVRSCVKTGAIGFTPHHWANPISHLHKLCTGKCIHVIAVPTLEPATTPSAVCSATRELAMATSPWSAQPAPFPPSVCTVKDNINFYISGKQCWSKRGWSRCSMVSSLRRRK